MIIQKRAILALTLQESLFLCNQVNFQVVMNMKYCCPFMIIVSHYMEHITNVWLPAYLS